MLHVAMISPEIAPFAKTGGLGDVIGSLPQALQRLGSRLSLIMPAYRTVLGGGFPLEDTGIRLTAPVSDRTETATVLKATTRPGISLYFIRADRYFDRDGLYGTPEGDYPDNAERFVFFSRAALELLRHSPPAILHAHDWESALAIAFLKAQPQQYPELSGTKTVLTVHNLGYQGRFPQPDWHLLGLDRSLFTPGYLEFYGGINFLKGGLVSADAITTVSPTYAGEIKTPEYGFGLDGVLRERATRLVGILNGADYETWNPGTDPYIPRTYRRTKPAGKKACKAALQREFSLTRMPDTPLIGMVTRLAEQKGADLLASALDGLLSRDLQLVILGTGERRYEELFSRMAARHPGKLGVRIAFEEALAHRVIAGANILLMPSRYEPGGLTQVYALRYGTIPVVRATGGLRDTVQQFDPETGIGNGLLFGGYDVSELLDTLDQALALFRQKKPWATLMRNAMAADYSWKHSAQAYLDLYRKLVASG